MEQSVSEKSEHIYINIYKNREIKVHRKRDISHFFSQN